VILLFQFVSYLFEQLSILLLASHKEVQRIDAQRNNTENQEDDEIAKTSGHWAVPLSFDWISIT
jgi:hypothetical protein